MNRSLLRWRSPHGRCAPSKRDGGYRLLSGEIIGRSPVPTFPGESLLHLGADSIDVIDATRQSLIEFEGIRDKFLPKGSRTHQGAAPTRATSRCALLAAMLHGAVDPGLLDEVRWWRRDNLWYWSLEALVAYVRAAGDRAGDFRVDPSSYCPRKRDHPGRRRGSLPDWHRDSTPDTSAANAMVAVASR
jgi:hypothetical protein